MRKQFFALALVLGLGGLMALSCGGGMSTSSTAGTVTTSLSDPPTCTNSFGHVYVTITKVTAHINADAGPNDSGWQTLVDLTGSPMQVDLLTLNPAATPGFCGTLFTLDHRTLPAGTYQQIRLYLLDNSATSGPASNLCGSAGFNCVIPTASSVPAELLLSSESQTGIKIPSSRIISGGLTVMAGQSVDLNIDFHTCASIEMGGNMQFRLKPVLHAGEVSLNMNSIQGSVVDSATGSAIGGATVLLEQAATITGIADPVDQVKSATTTDSTGGFTFCALGAPGTTYDLAVAAQAGGATYNPDIVFNVPVGTSLGALKLVSEGASKSGGSLAGQITSAGASGGVGADLTLSPLVAATPMGGSQTLVTIPWLSTNTTQPAAQPQNFMTQTPANVVVPPVNCPMNTDCYNYAIALPASAAQVGTFSNGSANLPTPPTTPTLSITYRLLGATPACTGSTPSPAITPASPALTVTPGATTAVTTVLAFTGCT
jgi:uncharacterized protein DUF4382